MAGAFLYLSVCSIRNRVRRWLWRLREPRYLVGLVAGLAYFYLMFFRGSGRSGRNVAVTGGASVLSMLAVPAQVLGSLLLFIVAAVGWVLPGAGRAITFSRPEVQFLFPAPVTRRELIHYKLLRSQLGVGFSSIILTLFMRPASLGQGWMITAGVWLLMMVVSLHFTGVALSRMSLAQHGRSGLARQWAPLAVVLGCVAILIWTLAENRAALGALLEDRGRLMDELLRLSTTGAAGVVLWPFRALVRLPISATPSEFLSALPPVLAMLALNYAWVLRSDAAFEEASAAHAEKRAIERAAPKPVARSGRTATPFRLAIDGPPETAILWKNLILLGRYASVRTLVRIVPFVLILALAVRGYGRGLGGYAVFFGVTSLGFGAMMMLMGPQMMRNDLRQDLASLALLKTWPVRGAALVRGEVLAPTLVMSVVVWTLVLTGALLTGDLPRGGGFAGVIPASKWSFVAAAIVVAPAVLLPQIVLLNGLAVLFPAWSVTGASRARGIAAMGQRMLMLAGIMLTLAVSLLPAAAVAGLVVFAVYFFTHALLIVLPAFFFTAFVLAECWLIIEALGRVLDRIDVTAIDAAE